MELSPDCMYEFKTIKGVDMSGVFCDSPNESSDNILNIKQKKWRNKEDTYNIIRYNKNMLTPDKYDSSGLFRSVIHKNGKMVCFSPPKSMDHTSFKDMVDMTKGISVEEYVEGTMINLFWTGTEWEIATRSSVGGKVHFFVNDNPHCQKTFRQMFLEAIAYHETNKEFDFFSMLENVPKDICMSFVLQHPDNRIVVPFDTPNIYLVKAYKLMDDYVVKEVAISTVSQYLPNWVEYPYTLKYSIEDITTMLEVGSVNFEYTKVGVMMYGMHKHTGKVVRTKIRNSNYEYVRELRGNQPKLQYRYLMLRQHKKVSEYLKYFPEHKTAFNSYRNNVHTFSYALYKKYISCYMHKQNPLKMYSLKYRTHMYKLHESYLMDKNNHINLNRVIDYVNNLHPTLLMHSINYHYKTN